MCGETLTLTQTAVTLIRGFGASSKERERIGSILGNKKESN